MYGAGLTYLEESTLHLVLRLRGGYSPELSALRQVQEDSAETVRVMDICAGGLINQDIVVDPGIYEWGASPIGTIKVRVVDFDEFKHLTGLLPPGLPRLPGGYAEPREWRQEDNTQIESLAAGHHRQLKEEPKRAEYSSRTPNGGRRAEIYQDSESSNSHPQLAIGTAVSGSSEETHKGIRRRFWRKRDEARTGQSANIGPKSRAGFWSHLSCWK
jgi:hypothetical protein